MSNIASIYSIGIPEMDAQHAHWITLINEFRAVGSDHLLDQSGVMAAKTALDKLIEYTRSHFASEERFIAQHNYPDIEAHKLMHRALELEVLALQQELQAHKTGTTPLKLNLLVTIWLLEHIMKEDDKYAKFILGKSSIKGS